MEIKFILNTKETEAFLRYASSSSKSHKNIVKSIVLNELRETGSFLNAHQKRSFINNAIMTIKGSYDLGIIAVDLYNISQDFDKLYVGLINLCFALETSFKSLLNYNSIQYGKTHDLSLLFKKLPDEIKKEAINHTKKIFEEIGYIGLESEDKFYDILEEHKKLYERLRYYELDNRDSQLSFNANFIISLSDFIISTTFSLIDKTIVKEENIKLQIREKRKINNIALEKMAIDLEMTPYVLNTYELNDKTPDLKTLLKISKYLGVSIDDLLLREDEKNV